MPVTPNDEQATALGILAVDIAYFEQDGTIVLRPDNPHGASTVDPDGTVRDAAGYPIDPFAD